MGIVRFLPAGSAADDELLASLNIDIDVVQDLMIRAALVSGCTCSYARANSPVCSIKICNVSFALSRPPSIRHKILSR